MLIIFFIKFLLFLLKDILLLLEAVLFMNKFELVLFIIIFSLWLLLGFKCLYLIYWLVVFKDEDSFGIPIEFIFFLLKIFFLYKLILFPKKNWIWAFFLIDPIFWFI